MKQYFKLSFFLIMAALFLVGCGDNEETDHAIAEEESSNQETEEETEEQTEETDLSEENDGAEEDEANEDESESNDAPISHQEGLKIGETGTVVSGDIYDNRSYEITLNSVEYKDSVAGLKPSEDTYAVVNITVKNTDDSVLDVEQIQDPGFGKEFELTGTLNPVLLDYQDRVDEDLLEGEIAPGEEITGVHIFDIPKNDVYVLAFGGSGSQIVTYAQWEVTDDEIEQSAD